MVERFLFAAPVVDVVALPQLGELGALCGQLVDQGGQVGGVGIGCEEAAQVGDAADGRMVPVGEKLAGRRVQEDVSDGVAAVLWPAADAGEQRQGLGVGGQDVAGPAQHVCGAGPDVFQEQAWSASAYRWACSSSSRRSAWARVSRTVLLGLVSLPCSRRT